MKRLLIIFLCLFCLSACSTKLAYNFLGFIFKWYVGSYVSLDRTQKDFLDGAVDDFHGWHRDTQLQQYADYIDGVIERIHSDEITGQWVHAETDKVQDLLDHSVNYLKPSIADLMASFSDKQSKELLDSFAKDRKKYQKKYIDASDKKVRNRRRNELTDQLGPFFGRFTSEQKEWIEQWADDMKPFESLALMQQQTWAERVEQALVIRHSTKELNDKLNQIMFYRTDDWDPSLQAILDYNQDITYALIAKLVVTQTPKQRKKMLAKLEGYRDDLRELAKAKSKKQHN